MTEKELLILSSLGGLAFLIMIIVVIRDKRKPKWKKVHDYVFTIMYNLDQDDDYNQLVQMRETVVKDFNLSYEEADKCIEKVFNQEWYRLNIK